MNPTLRNRLIAVGVGGALTIATVLIKDQEGVVYTPYRDVAGVMTVCYGHTGADIVPSKRYSQEECDTLLKADMQPAVKAVETYVTVPMSKYQKAALISFTYNVGVGALSRSTLLRKLNQGDKSEACDELRRWNRAGGKVWRGLVSRREVERELCLW